MRWLSIFLLMLPWTVLAGPAEDEAAVWELEESYWRFVKAQDLDAYRGLWDERFVGWPSFSPQALGKDRITEWIPPLHQDPSRVYDYELKREAVRSFGDVVVAHYRYRNVYRKRGSSEVLEEGRWNRITHTWMRRGNGWQIVTGMSASYDH